MQTGIFGSRFDSFARRVAILSPILLLCSAPPPKLLGQDVGFSSGSVLRIHGVVLNTLTNKPVGRALVTLKEMAALTDSDGRFAFDLRLSMGNLTGGSAYRVSSGRSGGFPMVWMARRPGYLTLQRPNMLLLRYKTPEVPEQTIKIMPESILRARLATAAAEPPVGVQVELFRKQVQDGLANWGLVGAAQTNSRGEYCFTDLSAGDYKVMTP